MVRTRSMNRLANFVVSVRMGRSFLPELPKAGLPPLGIGNGIMFKDGGPESLIWGIGTRVVPSVIVHELERLKIPHAEYGVSEEEFEPAFVLKVIACTEEFHHLQQFLKAAPIRNIRVDAAPKKGKRDE